MDDNGNFWGGFGVGFFVMSIISIIIVINTKTITSDKPIKPELRIEIKNGVADTTYIYNK